MWYIDLPTWEGTQADLQMVAGADTMLDRISDNGDEVVLNISEENFEGADELKFKSLAEDMGEGAYYILDNYKGNNIELEMWLCEVTTYIFNGFPKSIFIQHIQ